MGYTTDFSGQFTLDRPLDDETREFLHKLAETRRMKRKFPNDEYGVDGEFFVDGKGMCGQDDDETVVNHNCCPSTQPGLWCQWIPNEDGTAIEWDGGEKFYEYVEWIEYIVEKILKPKGYVLNGDVEWFGEENDDRGMIRIVDNEIKVADAVINYDFGE